jgi:hypothetical protein
MAPQLRGGPRARRRARRGFVSAPADGSGATSGYDRIGIPSENGETRYLTRQQFEALPLQERVSLLMKGKLQFYRGGKAVAAREALRSA